MSLLLALDFDGTIAPIRLDPESVEADPQMLKLIDEAIQAGVDVAVVSGRDLDDLRTRMGDRHLWLSGSHGREVLTPESQRESRVEPLEKELPSQLEDELLGAGFRLEKKRYGVALHWRGNEALERETELIGGFRKWGTAHGMVENPGRMVLELSLGKADKRDVVEDLASRLKSSVVIYAGDDLTDFAAIEWAGSRGRGYFVASSEREESPDGAISVAGIDELAEVLREEVRRWL